MLTLSKFLSAFPTLARFSKEARGGFLRLSKSCFSNTYLRKSKLGKISLIRKNRWGNSASRMYDRRLKIKRNLATMLNTGRVSDSANPNLLSLQLKNIGNRSKRKAYAKIVKHAGRSIGKVF